MTFGRDSLQVSRYTLAALVLAISASSALAHGIAGNRYFDGTMTFDDPAAATIAACGCDLVGMSPHGH